MFLYLRIVFLNFEACLYATEISFKLGSPCMLCMTGLYFININPHYKRNHFEKIMKKTIVFLVLLLTAGPLLADDDFGFRFGLNASPNLSWFRTETRGYDNRGVDLGFSYGLIVDYEFAQNYAVTSGLNILSTGGKMRYRYLHEGVDTHKRRDYNLRYLELPLGLKLRTDEMGFMTYYGQFGLGFGFNIRAKADDRIYLEEDSTLRFSEVDISDETRFLRASLIIGAGAEYSLGGRTSLLGGITFHNSFANILDVDNPAVATSPSAVNNYLELTLGVMF